jgi:ATP synthase protein I
MSPQERAQFEERISDLGDRLNRVRSQREAGRHADTDAEMRGRGIAYGMRMAADLVASVIVGGVIGWGLDWVLGSRPWLFLVFFLVGFAAGIRNLLRTYERMQREYAARGGGIGQSLPDDE